ncbi:hypothetical protein [Allorhizocola rhizosphaerae]|uniref:hypothetical protein n=1 Tax=Allorhizocola rhizosphaerae TaxID=1872709 RepID=UPI0013C2DF40|nr:hypothetical protein [Allorhizocola rhizosphaerae]
MATTAVFLNAGVSGAQALDPDSPGPAQAAPCKGESSRQKDNGAVTAVATITCPLIKIEFSRTVTPSSGGSCDALAPKLDFEPLTAGGAINYETTCSGTGLAEGELVAERKVVVTEQATGKTLFKWTSKRVAGPAGESRHTTQRVGRQTEAKESGKITYNSASPTDTSLCGTSTDFPVDSMIVGMDECVDTGQAD